MRCRAEVTHPSGRDPLRVIQVVPHIGNEASGPAYSVTRLSQSLAELGAAVTLMSVSGEARPPENNFQHLVFPRSRTMGALWGSPALHGSLRSRTREADVVHTHSLWLMPNVYPGRVCRRARKPLVVSPRGTLSRWALRQSRFRKAAMWQLLQRGAIASAACFHATSQAEADDVRRIGFRQPICVIANGVDVPDIPSEGCGPPRHGRKLLFLSRLHPTKGLPSLLHAWSRLSNSLADWSLRIVGPSERGHGEEMQRLAAELALPRVEFVGPVTGEQKNCEYQRAGLLVLPTHSENFGMVVAEALANGTPVLTTNQAPWEGLLSERCGWWIEDSVDALTAALKTACTTPGEELAAMGQRGRAWMQRSFSWAAVACEMNAVYRWLVRGGDTPRSVRSDWLL